jgi:outer membrane protein assembly factor BamB
MDHAAQPGGPAASSGPALDPETVPRYPVIPLEVTEDDQVLVNGQPIEIPDGMTPFQAGIAAVAAEAAIMPGHVDAVRVAATANGATWPLIVTADGQIVDLTPPPARPRPPWLLPLVAALVTVLLAGVGLVVVKSLSSRNRTQVTAPAPPAPLTPIGAGANLPVPPPPGHSTRAVWSVRLDPQTDPVSTSDGRILAKLATGQLALLDPATGTTLWVGQDPPRTGDLHFAQMQGQSMASANTTLEVTVWPMPPLPAPGTVPPTTGTAKGAAIRLPERGRLTWAAGAPFAVLPDQTAAILTTAAVTLLDVPVGADAVATDGDIVLAVDPTGLWWHLTPGQPLPAARRLAPAQRGTTAVRVFALGVDRVLAVWEAPDGNQVAAVHGLPSGAPSAVVRLPAGVTIDRERPVSDASGTTTAVGPVLAHPDGRLNLLEVRRVTSISGGHVYGRHRDRNELVDIDISSGTPRPGAPITSESIPVGIVPTPSGPLALVPANKLGERLLYALPRG